MHLKHVISWAGLSTVLALGFLPSAALQPPQRQLPQTVKWRIVKSPDQGPQPGANTFLAAADLSPTDAWAVGMRPLTTGFQTATLAEHWDGTRWMIVATPRVFQPTAQLNSATTDPQGDVWVAGYSDNPSCLCGHTIVEQWNGQSWSRIASPNPGVADYIDGITATSSTDVWVAGQEWITQGSFVPLIMHYDGQHWTIENTSRYAGGALFATFASGPNDAWAIGNIGVVGNNAVLALHWNGSFWQQVTFPSEQGGYIIIRGISGVAGDDLWTAGFAVTNDQSQYSALTFHWDGNSWTQVYLPNLTQPSYFVGVKAIASNDVWAVGQGVVQPNNNNVQNVTYHWDGSNWSNVANPDNLQESIFNGIAASSSTDIWAVGTGSTQMPSHAGTFTMHYGP
ncbi:MAG TPA: hypothetical protein VEV38_08620 [Candidatus Eremiobacteraceae bacterium]|nr:hypothetical protein [Candidatus Eremiobacteraceae bacterium]